MAAITQPVVWTSLVGVSAAGDSLTKTAANGWGNGGAVSVQQLNFGDGYVEVTASETTSFRMFGLSNGNTDAGYADIDYAMFLLTNGSIQIYEKGVYVATPSLYATGDKLQVAVEAGVVKYKRNGVVLRTSGASPTYPLLVDTALFSSGATLTNAVISRYVPTVALADTAAAGDLGIARALDKALADAATAGDLGIARALDKALADAATVSDASRVIALARAILDAAVLADTIAPYTTPSTRILAVAAEVRSWLVEQETRTMTVAAESRSDEVEP